MKCPKCGAENNDTAHFCSNCATKLDLSDQGSFTRTLETGTDELARGTTFAGRYAIIDELGPGDAIPINYGWMWVHGGTYHTP